MRRYNIKISRDRAECLVITIGDEVIQSARDLWDYLGKLVPEGTDEDPLPRVPSETVAEYKARGGQITRVKPKKPGQRGRVGVYKRRPLTEKEKAVVEAALAAMGLSGRG